MFEYEVGFIGTFETDFIYGYSFIDACARARIDSNCVECLSESYIGDCCPSEFY